MGLGMRLSWLQFTMVYTAWHIAENEVVTVLQNLVNSLEKIVMLAEKSLSWNSIT